MKTTPFLWILNRIRRRIPAIVVMTLAQAGSALLAVLFALGSRGVIDAAVAGEEAAFARACVWQVGIIAGLLGCQVLARHLRDRLEADLERDWKQRLLRGLLCGEYEQVAAYHSGELLNRMNNDVRRMNEGVLSIVPGAASMITRLLAAVVVLGALDLRFTLLIAALGVVAAGATAVMRRRLKELSKNVSRQDGKVSSFLQEILEKLLMVQAMDVSEEVNRRADVLLQERYQVQKKRKNAVLMANTGISVMALGSGFLALLWCGGKLLQGQMSFGSLTAVIQLVNQLQTPFMNLSGLLPQYVAMVASAERLMELEAIEGEPAPLGDDPKALYNRKQLIYAQGLDFAYDRDQLLEDAAFTLPLRSFVVITGPSGIGKSTLLKLMLGVFCPQRGKMALQGEGDDVQLDRSTRRLFAYVPQGNLLLSGSLRENLRIVRPEATEEELRQAAYVSALDEVLQQLPEGLDTVLGENAAGLSEGQAQRLAIARGVLSGAPILLLDESTSALDEATEQKVLRRLKELPG
ncbi:MAG: ABC transporter ATP-binding protein, partial [Clostridia bacterium]|nr:ABC transporter ATP-binding protein [Clostridia bacterium]